jgi:hypothetical protein
MASNPIKLSDLFKYDSSIKRAIADMEEFDRRLKGLAASVKENAGKLDVKVKGASPGSSQGQDVIKDASKDAELLRKENEKLKFAQTETAKSIAGVKNELQAKQTINKLEAKYAASAPGSYDRLSATYAMNKIRLSGMTDQQRYATVEGQKLERQSRQIYEQMNRMQKATGVYNLQVGNYKLATEGLLVTLKKQQASLKALEQGGKRNSAAYKQMKQDIAGTRAEIQNLNQAQTGQSSAMMGVWRNLKMMAGMYIGFAAAMRLFSSTSKILVGFEQQMSKVGAITLATDEQFKMLRDDAQRLGAVTARTATEVGGLQVEFGKLGFSTKEILNATEATIMLSQATMEDLSKSAETAGATLRGFGLDASETTRVVDVMASSFTSSALNLERFGEAMKHVAPVSKITGTSLEYTTAMMSALADAGIHGSMAGTTLKNVFARIAVEGEPFNVSLRRLAESGLSMSEAMQIMGKRAFAGLLVLTENIDKIDQLDAKYQQAEGTAKKMSDTMMDNLAGSVTIMKSAWEGLMLTMSGANGVIRVIVDGLTGMFQWMTRNITVIVNITKGITLAVVAWATYRIAMRMLIVDMKMGIRTMTLQTLALHIKTVAVMRATAAQQAFNLAMKASFGPISMILSLVVTAGAAFLMFKKRSDEAKQSTKGVTTQIVEESASLNVLFARLKMAGEGTKERSELIKTINSEYASYLPYLIKEGDKLDRIEAAQKAANIELRKNIALKEMVREMEAVTLDQLTKEKEATDKVAESLREAGNEKMAAGAAGAFQDFLDEVMKVQDTVDTMDLFKAVDPSQLKTEELKKEFGKTLDIVGQFDKKMSAYGIAWEDLDIDIFALIASKKGQDEALERIRAFYSKAAGFELETPEPEGPKKIDEKDLDKKAKLRISVMSEGLQKELKELELSYQDKYDEFVEAQEDTRAVDEWYRVKKQMIYDKYEKEAQDKVKKTESLKLDAMKDGQEKDLAGLKIAFDEKERLWKDAMIDTGPLFERYNEDIAKINEKYRQEEIKKQYEAQERRIDDMEDGYEKELATIELAYSKRISAGRDLFAAEAWRAKQIEELDRKTAKEKSDKMLEAFDEQQKFDEAVFNSVKRTEEEKYLFTLQAEKKRLEKVMELMEMTDIQRATIKAALDGVTRELNDYKPPAKKIDLFDMLGFDLKDEQKAAVRDSIQFAVSQINELMQKQVEAAQLEVDKAKERVENARQALDQEYENRNAGYASNIEGAQKAFKQEEQLEKEALKRKESAVKQQQQLDSITQASSLITATAKIWESLGGIPLLAIAAIALMWGSFIAAKTKAAQLTKTEMRKGGYRELKGGSHESGKDIHLADVGGESVYAEGGEGMAVFSRQAVQRYKNVLPEIVDQINTGKLEPAKKKTGAEKIRDYILPGYVSPRERKEMVIKEMVTNNTLQNSLASRAMTSTREVVDRSESRRDVVRYMISHREMDRQRTIKDTHVSEKINMNLGDIGKDLKAIRRQRERQHIYSEGRHIEIYKNIKIEHV